ncbi:glypican-5-like, partial [Hetaerina americana]|uniref:glypican-5-like n=1 Tax=Hetaerina americana TaxID=62018 RepID=UPI003A7F245C
METKTKRMMLLLVIAGFAVMPGDASPPSGRAASAADLAPPPASALTCAGVRPIFLMKNISDHIPEEPVSGSGLTVCEAVPHPGLADGRSCCTPKMERGLLSLVARDFDSVLHHHSRSLQGLLADAAAKIQDHVMELTRQSENKTQALLAALYERMSGPARPTVATLFDDLRRYLLEPEEEDFDEELLESDLKDLDGTPRRGQRAEVVVPPPTPDEAVANFFTELFPLVYRHALNSHLRPGDHFTGDFDACLRATRSEVLPFGDSPRRAASSVGRALGATRVLLRSLRTGSAAVSTASRRLQRSGRSSPCDAALLRMTYCARCRGISPSLRPCAGLCLNALRGCLTPLAELELPWAAYVESAERLVAAMVGDPPTAPAQVYTSDSTSSSSARHGVARILASLDSWISEAIMYALENGPTLEKK